MTAADRDRAGRIEGPAKWAAVVVLGGAGLVGIGRSFLVDSVHAPPAPQAIQTVRVEPKPSQAPERDDTASEAADTGVSPVVEPDATEDEPAVPDAAVRINVNTASAAELDLLPGIGAVYAERIVAERQANGVFTSVRDLQRVRGIGPKTAAKLEPLVSFDRP